MVVLMLKSVCAVSIIHHFASERVPKLVRVVVRFDRSSRKRGPNALPRLRFLKLCVGLPKARLRQGRVTRRVSEELAVGLASAASVLDPLGNVTCVGRLSAFS